MFLSLLTFLQNNNVQGWVQQFFWIDKYFKNLAFKSFRFYMFFWIIIAGIFISIIGTQYYKKRVEPKEDQEITYEKKILDRIDDLEKSIKEIRDSLKKRDSS